MRLTSLADSISSSVAPDPSLPGSLTLLGLSSAAESFTSRPVWLCIRIWHCSALHVSGELLEDPSLARANHVCRRSQISEVHAWAVVQRLRPDLTQSVSSDRQAYVQSVALRAQCAAQRGDSASL